MEIPKSIKVGGHKVKVKFTEHYIRDDNRCGSSNGVGLEIQLDQSMPETTLGSTLLHEIIEQVNYHNEIGLEHRQITALEASLYQVIRDNKLRF